MRAVFIVGIVHAYQTTLADCEAFAALFDNTCSEGPIDTADWAS
jgi:putative component of membrane protein insertase Oxa1/YidC/SpoIIIJ protein YidD